MERATTSQPNPFTGTFSQPHSWWQNEAGEPMFSPEAIRAEERADSEYEPEYDDYGDFDYDYDED
tara:strand:+ start:202 stop:396 length:195 start_codon:yes stop_codon:yes gene_type:complete